MLKKVLIGVAVLIGAFAAFVAMLPSDYRLERSIVISAPAEKIFPYLNDLHKEDAWSPWSKLDPAMKKTFSGPESGVGSVYGWDGNDKVGAGQLTITDVQENARVARKLEFTRPYQSAADTEITLKPQEGGTLVTWSMSGHKGYIDKAFCFFMDMEKMVGPDFEKGLAQLKALVEG